MLELQQKIGSCKRTTFTQKSINAKGFSFAYYSPLGLKKKCFLKKKNPPGLASMYFYQTELNISQFQSHKIHRSGISCSLETPIDEFIDSQGVRCLVGILNSISLISAILSTIRQIYTASFHVMASLILHCCYKFYNSVSFL